ncbi:MAG: efflux RND transporter permease subunit [Cytophagales bacterium]|nr:efflux RND transporter permease subunit [Cytophagales bacterium]
MLKLTKFALEYPVTVLMIVLGIILLGYISFSKLGVDLFPDLNNPRIFVEIKAGEKPPEEIEEQFVDHMEALAIRQSDVVGVSSVSKVGSALITVEYSWEKDMDEAFLDIQKALTDYSQNTEIDEINISQFDPNATPIVVVAMTHTSLNDLDELRKTAENYIRNELIRLEGVADVTLSGKEVAEVVIATDNYLLEAHNLTTSIISQQIQNYNRNVSGGSIDEMGMKYVIKGESVLKEVRDIGNIIVTFKEPGEDNRLLEKTPVFLKDLASIELKNKDPENIVKINGDRSIGLSIYKEPKYNTVKVVESLDKAFENIKKALPGYEFEIVQNQGTFISNAIDEVEETALIGICLAVIVLFVFLKRIGTTLVISIAIPVSIIATFNLMYFNGLTLNIMTLGGLALGAGMLVDNAIIVMENIFRNLESGLSAKEAAVKGTAEVGGAITASTITTIIVFLPIVYLQGVSGELFKDQAWTVAFSLLSSLFVAIFFIPVLFNGFFKNAAGTKKYKSIKFAWYGQALEKALRVKWVVIVFSIALLTGTVFVVPHVGNEFMPKAESNEFSINFKLPEGTRLARTNKTAAGLETTARNLLGDNVATIYTHVGPSDTESINTVFEDEHTGSLRVILNKNKAVSASGIINALGTVMENIPDLDIEFVRDETALQSILGTDTAPIIVEVSGDDLDMVDSLSVRVKNKLAAMEELFNVKTSMEGGAPEIDLVIDRYQAGLFNISVNEIISQIQNQLEGAEAGDFDSEGELKDITIKLPEVSRGALADMKITSGNDFMRLQDLAKIQTNLAPKEIIRRNQNRIAEVTAQYKPDFHFDRIVKKIETEVSNIQLPPNYKITVSGEELLRKESMESLSFALVLSLILVYMVLASQFESLIHPFTILLTIPLAGVGAILIFFLLGNPLNIMAYIGIIMLVGIAVNDSIILVDAINQLKKNGKSTKQAITGAGQQRIRPIIMTSLTTILALLPLTFGFGESAALRSPMALAVIGGLVTSTALTLIVIPCVYAVIDQLVDWITDKMHVKN